LNTDEKLQVVRQMTEITNNLHYSNLQQHLWQAYYNLGIKENLWVSSATESSTSSEANQPNPKHPYYFPKKLFEQRQQRVIWQKQRTINELQECLIFLQQHVPQWQPSIDLELLLRTVTECVKKGQ
jgi:hypothetical protein